MEVLSVRFRDPLTGAIFEGTTGTIISASNAESFVISVPWASVRHAAASELGRGVLVPASSTSAADARHRPKH